jgi:hypothetical protein
VADEIPNKGQVSVVAAGLLNWLWGGAGYFVIGQNTKGIVFCLITLMLVIFAIVTCGLGVIFLVPYAIVVIIDAVLLAQRVNRGEVIQEWQFF